MHWLEIHIDTNHAGLEEVQALLSSLDVDGVMIEDEEEFRDFLENNHDYWDYVDEDLERRMAGRSRVTFYLEANESGFARLGEVRIALQGLKQDRRDLGSLLMTLEDVQDADWENNWKQYYKPMACWSSPSGRRRTRGIECPSTWTRASPSAPGPTPPPASA